jgi:hypothetical protein
VLVGRSKKDFCWNLWLGEEKTGWVEREVPLPGGEGNSNQSGRLGNPHIQYECLPATEISLQIPQFSNESILVGTSIQLWSYSLDELGEIRAARVQERNGVQRFGGLQSSGTCKNKGRDY